MKGIESLRATRTGLHADVKSTSLNKMESKLIIEVLGNIYEDVIHEISPCTEVKRSSLCIGGYSNQVCSINACPDEKQEIMPGIREAYIKRSNTLILSRADYISRVEAMWTAQVVAVQLGLQFEHKPAAVKWIDNYPPNKLNELEKSRGPTVDDDWYYEMCAPGRFEKYGYDMTVEEMGDVWLDFNSGTFGSAYYTRKALSEGHGESEAGSPRYNRMWFSVGNQNRMIFMQ